MKDFERGQEMVSRAHRFLIDSGQFTYRTFVRSFLESELPNRVGNGFRSGAGRGAGIFDSCTDDEMAEILQIARRRFAWSPFGRGHHEAKGAPSMDSKTAKQPETLVEQVIEMMELGSFSMLGMVKPVTSADRLLQAAESGRGEATGV